MRMTVLQVHSQTTAGMKHESDQTIQNQECCCQFNKATTTTSSSSVQQEGSSGVPVTAPQHGNLGNNTHHPHDNGTSGNTGLDCSIQHMETGCAGELKGGGSLIESLCQPGDPGSGSQAVDNLDTLVGDLNLELMATYKEMPGGEVGRRALDHMGDSFESLQASLNSLQGSDLNLDHLDLLDIPELDKICTDMSGSSHVNSQVSQGCGKGQVAVETNSDFSNLELSNINANSLLLGRQGMGSGGYVGNMAMNSKAGGGMSDGQLPVTTMTHTYHNVGPSPSSVAMVTDFSPEWAYTEVRSPLMIVYL